MNNFSTGPSMNFSLRYNKQNLSPIGSVLSNPNIHRKYTWMYSIENPNTNGNTFNYAFCAYCSVICSTLTQNMIWFSGKVELKIALRYIIFYIITSPTFYKILFWFDFQKLWTALNHILETMNSPKPYFRNYEQP